MTASSFSQEIAASFPSGLALPNEFRQLFDWMEANGFVQNWRNRSGRFAGLYPATMGYEGTSLVVFKAVDTDHARFWTGVADPAVTSRLAPFIRTGGDGSHAGLWLDTDGVPRFVHLGSGSGSTWAGVMAENAVEVLRLLAVGYSEPAFPECHDRAPEEEAAAEGLSFVPPVLFRTWVSETFGVAIPARGSEVVPRTPHMHDTGSGDPFLAWVEEMQARFG